MEQKEQMEIPFVPIVPFFGGWAARWAACAHAAHRAEVEGFIWWVLLLVCGSPRGLVCGFGNEGVVLNEGARDYSFRPVDSELDECKRDPLIALLDDAGLAENDFLRYEVMREAVSFTCHKAPPVFGLFVFVDLCVLSWPELCFDWGLVGLAASLLRLTG